MMFMRAVSFHILDLFADLFQLGFALDDNLVDRFRSTWLDKLAGDQRIRIVLLAADCTTRWQCFVLRQGSVGCFPKTAGKYDRRTKRGSSQTRVAVSWITRTFICSKTLNSTALWGRQLFSDRHCR